MSLSSAPQGLSAACKACLSLAFIVLLEAILQVPGPNMAQQPCLADREASDATRPRQRPHLQTTTGDTKILALAFRKDTTS